MAAEATIQVTVAWSPGPRQVHEEALRLPRGSTVAQAVQACAMANLGVGLPQAWGMGIWGNKVDASKVLQDGDRLELVRPLRVDPKAARRARFETQGARRAGLFARRRAGGKAGY